MNWKSGNDDLNVSSNKIKALKKFELHGQRGQRQQQIKSKVSQGSLTNQF